MDEGIITTKQYHIDELIFAEYNPRQLTKDQYQGLKDSITRFGLVDPVIINKHKERDNIIVGGHQRVKIAKDLGYKEVPCVEVNLTPEKERELNIRLNKNTGEWDWDSLANYFDVSDLLEWGFTDDELQFDPELVEGRIDDDEIPEVEEAITKSGDLWLLGEHKVLCGDATKKEDVEQLMDGQKADMVFTDSPYAIFGSSTGVASDISDDNMVRPFFRDILIASSKILKDFGHVYCCCDWRSWASWWEMAKRTDLDPKNMIVWDKGGGQGAMYTQNHELVGFYTKQPKETALGVKKTGHRTIRKFPKNVVRINRETDRHGHNAAKPIELCTNAIENSSDIGEICIDLFLGSGSTLIACEKTNRKCYGMEINPHYCDVIVKRWEEYTGNKAERIEAASA